jgi:hypothetical protein
VSPVDVIKVDRLPCCRRRPQPPDKGWPEAAEREVVRVCCPLRDDAGRVLRKRRFRARLVRAQAAAEQAVGRPFTFVRWEEID